MIGVETFISSGMSTEIDFRFRVCAARVCKHHRVEWSDGTASLSPGSTARLGRYKVPAAASRCRDCFQVIEFHWSATDADGKERPLTRREAKAIAERGNREAGLSGDDAA